MGTRARGESNRESNDGATAGRVATGAARVVDWEEDRSVRLVRSGDDESEGAPGCGVLVSNHYAVHVECGEVASWSGQRHVPAKLRA